MSINELLVQKNITKYRLWKESGVPQATISDICTGKTSIEKCSAETIYRIAKVLDVSMESLIAPSFSFWKPIRSASCMKRNGIQRHYIFWRCWTTSPERTMFQFAKTITIFVRQSCSGRCILPVSWFCARHWSLTRRRKNVIGWQSRSFCGLIS